MGRAAAIGLRWGAGLVFAVMLITIGLYAAGLIVRAPDVSSKAMARAKPPAAVPKLLSAPPPVAPPEEPLVVKRVLRLDSPLEHGDFAWDDKGVPAGPIVITIDLAAQTLSVFRGGHEIGVAAIMYGADEKPTPLGVYPITEKDADHVSNLYHAPMPYMLRLTNDGISIHGSEVEWGGATHGCIGVPVRFARLLFAQAALGDRVIITDGKMLHVGESLPAA